MDLTQIKTSTGKTITDFKIPEKLIQNDAPLVDLIIKSESMNDSERQYWFNLSDIMSEAQIEKLRDILTRERKKLAEIDAKYSKQNYNREEAMAMAKQKAAQRAEQRQDLRQREQAAEAEETEAEAAALAELEAL